jgi:Retrotransposon gag protein
MKGGSAGPWAVQKMTTYLAMVWPSWKTFEEELQATFYPVNLAKNALNLLIHLHQTVGMSLTQYALMFNTLKSQAGIMDDQILTALFMQGLHGRLKDAAKSSIPVPTKLAEWCEQVHQFNQVFHRSQYQMDAFGCINPVSTNISAAPVEPQVEVNCLSASENAQCYKE